MSKYVRTLRCRLKRPNVSGLFKKQIKKHQTRMVPLIKERLGNKLNEAISNKLKDMKPMNSLAYFEGFE